MVIIGFDFACLDMHFSVELSFFFCFLACYLVAFTWSYIYPRYPKDFFSSIRFSIKGRELANGPDRHEGRDPALNDTSSGLAQGSTPTSERMRKRGWTYLTFLLDETKYGIFCSRRTQQWHFTCSMVGVPRRVGCEACKKRRLKVSPHSFFRVRCPLRNY